MQFLSILTTLVSNNTPSDQFLTPVSEMGLLTMLLFVEISKLEIELLPRK